LHWEPSFKIVNAPANLKEAPGTGYPAKGVVLQKCMLYFQNRVEKVGQSAGSPNSSG
jgi:hypothetical protein